MNHEIHEAHEKAETLAEIVAALRHNSKGLMFYFHENENGSTHAMGADYADLADRIEAAAKREAESIERLIRDAIIDYQEMFAHAPNDDAERELVERAERGNAWLVAHGYEPEPVNFGKEEIPCL